MKLYIWTRVGSELWRKGGILQAMAEDQDQAVELVVAELFPEDDEVLHLNRSLWEERRAQLRHELKKEIPRVIEQPRALVYAH